MFGRHHQRHHHHGEDDQARGPHRGFGGWSAYGGQGSDYGGRWEGRAGRRAERMFEQGDLRLVLLALISEKASHGYELIKAIEERLAGVYSPSPGVVYPTLTFLEEAGFTTVTPEAGGKKLYAITPEGTAELGRNKAEVEKLFARMDALRSRSAKSSPKIGRAMQNLFTALRYRMAAGDLGEGDIQEIAAALDAAALAIEKRD
jgi:DNA-binding PadR family transcriptional regulator